MRRHPIPVVAACIVKENPLRVLLHKKNEAKDEHGVQRNPELVGLWEFPGGMIEGRELPEEALRREIGEELGGLHIRVGRLLDAKTVSFKDRKPYLVLFYICHTSYELEIEGCRYFALKSIKGIRTEVVPPDLSILHKVFEIYRD